MLLQCPNVELRLEVTNASMPSHAGRTPGADARGRTNEPHVRALLIDALLTLSRE